MKDRENTEAGQGPSQLPEDILHLLKIVIVCGNQFNHKYSLLHFYPLLSYWSV